MSNPSAGRDLLFGLLALQNNFIDREALLDAFHRRTAEPGKALDRILVDRGALSPALHSALSTMVDEHIRRHGGDPEQSLAALSSIGSTRESLSRIADPDMQASLAIVATARPTDDPYRTIDNPTLGESTSTGTRFRILRPHAKGGLGQVSVAIDRELDRPVALKEIQARHADEPQSRARFVQEGQITGKLEHPGIVPVYGLGHDPTGRPFYAMRFIQGDSLQDALRDYHRDESFKKDVERRLSRFRELLRRFTDVCNAIAYAHSRGVLHRDLKPGNIMLGPFGETLVVDWGLAKPVGSEASGEPGQIDRPVRLSGTGESSETMPGTGIGTPAFASPEQLRGDLDRLGPPTDIYGLGATLYSVLTGRPPVEGSDLFEVVARVERGDIPPPRSIDPTIPAPLEAICKRAMALKPEDRYESAKALAADVTRWLDDEPVSVYREPLSVRAGRWMRRHRTLMAGAAAAAVMGLVGLAVLAIAQDQHSRALKQANDKTNQALDSETNAKRETQEALARSEESRKRAEAVLEFLTNDLLAVARPEGQAGGLGVAVTVRRAVDATEPRIAERFKDQPLVEADVRGTLGTTYWYLGEGMAAIRQFQRVLEIRRAKLGPDHPQTLTTRNNLAVAYKAAGRTAEAIELYETVLKAEAAKLGPDHPETLTTRNNLANAYQAAGRTSEAIEEYEVVLKARKAKLGSDHPDTLSTRNNLAMAYQDGGRKEEAIKLYESVLTEKERKLGPDHPDTLTTLNNLANAYQAAGRNSEAIRRYEAVLRAQEVKLGPDHPDTLTTRNNLAVAYQAEGRTAEAMRLYEGVLKAREAKLGPDHPKTLTSRNNLAVAYQIVGRNEEAIKLYEALLKAKEEKLGPDHPETLSILSNIADAHEQTRRLDLAEPLRRLAVDRARKRFGPADPWTASALVGLGSTLLQQKKWAEAEPVLRECLVIREKTMPEDWTTFNTRSMLGDSLAGQKNYAEAEPLLVSGYEGMKAREAKIPAVARVRIDEAIERLVKLYEAWGKPEKAAESRAKRPKQPSGAKTGE